MCRWWSYIHANRQHPTFLAPDPLTDCCPTDPATHFGVRVEAATTAPHNELSSPLALVSTPWPAVARRSTTTSRRPTTLLALQPPEVPPPVAHGSSSNASHTVLQHWLWRFLKQQTESFASLHKVFSKIKASITNTTLSPPSFKTTT